MIDKNRNNKEKLLKTILLKENCDVLLSLGFK